MYNMNEDDDNVDDVDSETSECGLRRHRNVLYFWNTVTTKMVQNLCIQLSDMVYESAELKDKLQMTEPPPIIISLNSGGGELVAALHAYDRIRELSTTTKIYTRIDGECHSAATLLFLSVPRTQRIMNSHSIFLIHNLSTQFQGKYHELKDETKNCDALNDAVRAIFLSQTRLRSKQLSDLMNRDLYLLRAECETYGIV